MASATVPQMEPGSLASFVGRETELRDLVEAVGDSRLVTVVGPGGVGKTRFAGQAMRALSDRFDEPPLFIDLTPVHSPDRIGTAILAALGGQHRTGSEIDSVAALVADRALLLVLDNCEQVIDGAAEAAQRLLLGCPGLHLLATSREPLGVPGEAVFRLHPLPVPRDTASISQAEAAANPSVALFVDRASAAQRSFALTPATAPAVASICRAVDGIPLAIELAAARVRTLPVDQLANRVASGLGVLAGGPRTAPERHRTMHATIAWSVDALPPAERSLFRRLAVFTGGWTLEAAEGVCAGADVQPDSVLDLLESLVDRSLVVGAGGSGRFRLLEPILEYAREELLDSGEADGVGAAHCRWFRQLAAAAEPHLNAHGALYWLDVLEAENDNLRAALAWAATHRDQIDDGLQLAGDLLWFWNHTGLAAEGYRLTGRLLTTPFKASPRARVAALLAHHQCARWVGELDEAERAAAEAYDTSNELGDTLTMARSRVALGSIMQDTGRAEPGRRLLQEALVRAEADGSVWDIARTLIYLWVREDDPEQVQSLLGRALPLFRSIGCHTGLAAVNTGLGALARLRGDPAAAEFAYAEALSEAREARNVRMACLSLGNLSLTRIELGNVAAAYAPTREGLEIALRIGEVRLCQGAVLAAAGLEAVAGDAARAARWLACADAGAPIPIDPEDFPVRDGIYESVRRRLGDQFESEFQRGAGADVMTVAHEVRAVLSEIPQEAAPEPSDGVRLSARETEVLRLLAAGASNREIAQKLVLSTRTVETHIANVYSKIGVQNRVEATRWAIQAGLAPTA